ncbi:hypothetical protein BJY04DRAFT_166453 [Aspergillus karnatakaensis]|uniref:putative C6 finger domain protein n=1 Tax=Aspergillus karnatakaensis TaxID=1810916 RepID=UPI003CCD5A93
MNPISEIPPDTELHLEPVAADQPGRVEGQRLANAKSARKRTKTGCLTCRQRRIKCGEEKPICKNCTKSKRECKGYAQRLIFKNPLGIPGIPSAIPPQPQIPSQYETEIDFQLTSAGTHGPILAPKLPDRDQHPPPQPVESFQPDVRNPEMAFATQFSVPAQTLLPEIPPTYRPPNSSATFYQQEHEVLNHNRNEYPPYRNDSWVSQGSSSTAFHSQLPQSVQTHGPAPAPIYQPQEYSRAAAQSRIFSPVLPLSPFEYIDEEDDDYYDVESDEEVPEQVVAMQDFNQLNMVMASANRDETQLRLFTTYLNEPNVLASYHPTFSSSPLNNPKTARIFLHFINATGPALSIWERHPIDPSTMLGTTVPLPQQGLWTYTLPLKAFQHQALQQAILALSSLHIAYLQDATSTVSLKHYQYALKRLGRAVGLPTRRKQVGTLAATLVLAFYEVMTADHHKWNNHLAGSAQLIREIDFAGMTRDLRARRRHQWQERSNSNNFFQDIYSDPAFTDDPFADLESTIDENTIGIMLGRAVNYDQFGLVEEGGNRPQNKHLTRKDIENHRIKCDLYWWFCKQDWLQSLIGAKPLTLPFPLWGQCPPRAGLGCIDAIYGSADHLHLLMGRLAHFAGRDRKRKIKLSYPYGKSGPDWVPDARFGQFMGRFAPRPQGSGQGPPDHAPFGPPPGAPQQGGFGPPSDMKSRNRSQQSQGSKGAPQQSPSGSSPPPMYGMVPPTGPSRLPSAFAETAERQDSDSQSDEGDVWSYEEAESEWESILAAFELFGQSLGPDYMPLPADSTIPITSPFGPALQYRTHNIGSLWGFYYTGRIVLLRLHPSMPAGMMKAAGVAGSVTAGLAQTIGQIVAGVYVPQAGVEGFSPTLGSCLIEITVPLFFGGVQYMNPEQRAWTIAVLNDISRQTGWKSADAIARGCEKAWMATAEAGRGPSYKRVDDITTRLPPVWKYAELEANSERRFVTVSKPQITFAMGLLSLEDDLEETTG